MKSSKSEYFYLFLSVIVLSALAALYLVFGQNFGTYQSSAQTANTASKVAQEATAEKDLSPEEKHLMELEAALSDLEKAPSNEALVALQDQVATVADQAKKDGLQKRLDAVSTELANQAAAETAVANAEGYQILYNVDVAQAAINLLTSADKKAELQKRLDTVSAIIQATYVEQTTLAVPQQ
ncbi:peptidase [Streptococcus hillyeri]|uniref:Peptidase n=1 Tax=Streptococcus hillyeri TaxID=2282420 RepID=A0A3L9DQR1_9STRE|nr:peptidase [Streptococcus hillyeri]RLY03806.1 peptidase [Streptococcus hillyeri]